MNNELLGYCGLYCGGCGIFQNTAKGIATKLDDGQDYNCKGCNSDTLTPWCGDCAIKNCSREKGLEYCLKCGEFPCDKMTGFMDDPKYPYHKEVPEAMKRLDEIGLEAWSKEREARYTCGSCGEKFNWFEKKCAHCGGEVG